MNIDSDPRLAGEVIRFHCRPHIRTQSVGEHSWQVARILLCITAPAHWSALLVHSVTHDMGEIATGDVPYPVKAENPILGDLFHELEAEGYKRMAYDWNLPKAVPLSPTHRWMFKLAEFIEMWEWGLEENKKGNQFAAPVAIRCIRVVQEMCADPACAETANAAALYVAKRKEEW